MMKLSTNTNAPSSRLQTANIYPNIVEHCVNQDKKNDQVIMFNDTIVTSIKCTSLNISE